MMVCRFMVFIFVCHWACSSMIVAAHHKDSARSIVKSSAGRTHATTNTRGGKARCSPLAPVPPSPSSVNFARVFDQIGLLYQKGSTPIATIDTLLAEAILRSLLGSDHYALFQLKNLAYLQKQTLMEPLLEVINGLSVCREIDGLVAYTGGIGGGSKRCTITVEDKTKIRQALDCTHLTYPDEQLRIVELIRRQQ